MAVKRGASWSLTSEEEDALANELVMFVDAEVAAGRELWRFGTYGDFSAVGKRLEKKAPLIEALLKHARLWHILLRYAPSAKMRDSHFVKAIAKVIVERPFAKTLTTVADDLFLTWWVKSVHVQITHLRELKKYWRRFKFRIAKLDADQMDKLLTLMKAVTVDTEQAPTYTSIVSTATQQPMSSVEGTSPQKRHEACHCIIPEMFRDPSCTADSMLATPPRHIVSSVKRGREGTPPPCARPAREALELPAWLAAEVDKRLFAEACRTPSLPAKQGAMKAAMKKKPEEVVSAKGDVGDGTLFIERALKHPRRTTLRIRFGDRGPRRLFVEVTESQHKDCGRIAQHIFHAFRAGTIKTKDEARAMRARLIRN